MVHTLAPANGVDRVPLISHHKEVTVSPTPELLDLVDTLCMEFVADWDEWAALQRAAYPDIPIHDGDAHLAYVQDTIAHRKEAQAYSRRMVNRFGHEVYAEALKHYGF